MALHLRAALQQAALCGCLSGPRSDEDAGAAPFNARGRGGNIELAKRQARDGEMEGVLRHVALTAELEVQIIYQSSLHSLFRT